MKAQVKTKRVLVAPLNWGLGHATRCIPIIKTLLAHNFEVILASDGYALDLLRKEFSDLRAIALPSYDITYPTENMFYNILAQSKNIFKAIKKERRFLENIVNQYDINIVISDNRYGVLSKRCYNIFITHQLNIQTGFIISDYIAKQINHHFIKKYDEVWIPDLEASPSLAGKLSHSNDKLPLCKYLGILSRFERTCEVSSSSDAAPILVVLSGPEPQRTYFEALLLAQIATISTQFILVRGVIHQAQLAHQCANLTVYNYLTSNALFELFEQSSLVVSRSGYTTLMDLALTGKKALLIPTPGQTEQIYLAKHLASLGFCAYQSQSDLRLAEGISKALQCKGIDLTVKNNLNEVVKNLYLQID